MRSARNTLRDVALLGPWVACSWVGAITSDTACEGEGDTALVQLSHRRGGHRTRASEVELNRGRGAPPGLPGSPTLPDSPDPWNIGDFKSCYVSESSECSLDEMRKEPTLVYPGGDTKCLDGSAYAFIVVPGDSDKLLWDFEGGGQCWEAPPTNPSAVGLACQQNLAQAVYKSSIFSGIMNFSHAGNNLANHTLVYPMYCSGDSWWGNVSWTYTYNSTQQSLSQQVYQIGYTNAVATVGWAKKFLAPSLSQFTITGTSAGALAVMGWANKLLSTFQYTTAAVIADSEVDSLPADLATEEFQYRRLHICDTLGGGHWDCPQVNLQKWFQTTIRAFPQVAFAHVESKVDQRQTFFYNNVGQGLFGKLWKNITGEQFYQTTIQCFEKWWAEPNYIAYLTNGDQHCPTMWLTNNTYYTTTPDGPNTIDTSTGTPLYQWVGQLVARKPVWSECSGSVVVDVSTNPDGCSEKLPKKMLVLKNLK